MARYDRQTDVLQENEEIIEPVQEIPGRVGPIDETVIGKIYAEFKKYYDGKQSLNQRIKESEDWYKVRHWQQLRKEEDQPSSGYLFNALINKHADMMDNYPEASILPREADDKQTAQQLSKIIPTILEYNNYEKTYSDLAWAKLKTGTSVVGVFWNKSLDNGIGDVDVKEIDMLNIYWQPGIKNIQESKYVFLTDEIENDTLMEAYPFLDGPGGELNPEANYKNDDYIDRTNKTTIIDCYYKKTVPGADGTPGREVLHYIKFIPGHVLYASENDENYAGEGFYQHGKYPFVFDVMWPDKDTPAGFGYIDIMKEPQMYIDKMDGIVLRHAMRTARPRFFVSDSTDMNEEEFTSDSDLIHVAGSVEASRILQMQYAPLDASTFNRLQGKIEELKETSGNTDYAQGNSSGGVTAASAIAALQEASSKLSRDMIRQTYNAHTQTVLLVIEVIRQFYDLPRSFRVLGSDPGEYDFIQFSNAEMNGMQPGIAGVEFENRKPVYDIKVTSAKASPYSRTAQNELAKELYSAGVFNPEMGDQAMLLMEMMDFEGKEELKAKLANNQRLLQENMMLKQQMLQMGMIIDAQNGTSIAQGIAAQQGGQPMPGPAAGGKETNSVGDTREKNNIADKAKERTASRTNPN